MSDDLRSRAEQCSQAMRVYAEMDAFRDRGTFEETARLLRDLLEALSRHQQLDAVVAPTSDTNGAAAHVYVSTACHHGLHDRCRQSCKFCAVACACPCHGGNVEPR